MAKYIIEGGKTLRGTIKISGNKNSTFPCIAAALLTPKKVALRNIPDILDVRITLEILKRLGVEHKFERNTLIIDSSGIKTHTLPKDLMKKLRGSIVLVGALLSRFGKASFSFPGGDIVGKRSIDTHLEGFESLGFKVSRDDLSFKIKKTGTAKNYQVFLDEPSVTATENLILASVLGKKSIVLKNCAKEPHIVDLCSLLNKMGAKIEGVGGSTLKIMGRKKLSGADFRIGPDYIEIGTYAVCAAITRGRITINNIDKIDLDPILSHLKRFGVEFKKTGSKIVFWAGSLKSVSKLQTNIWPGFPTDMMSPMIVLATQAKGVTLCHDWMYESRMYFTDKLISMGADIIIADPHRVIISGPNKLIGRELETPDIRAGMALVLAALIARGKSTINKAELIERGYADVCGNLSKLGADIKRVE